MFSLFTERKEPRYDILPLQYIWHTLYPNTFMVKAFVNRPIKYNDRLQPCHGDTISQLHER